MRTFTVCLTTSMLAVTAWSLAARPSQDGAGLDPAAMAEMLELAQPGPEHDLLARYAGEWDVEISMNMMPGAPASKAAATAKATPILGRRFLELVTEGEMMGTTTESKVILGFDRRHEQWTSVGFDTMGTYWVSGSGVREQDGLLRLHGEDIDTLGKQLFYNEIDFAGADEFTFAVVFTKLGDTAFDPPYRMVELRYTRRK